MGHVSLSLPSRPVGDNYSSTRLSLIQGRIDPGTIVYITSDETVEPWWPRDGDDCRHVGGPTWREQAGTRPVVLWLVWLAVLFLAVASFWIL
jgi:hypothetical protein